MSIYLLKTVNNQILTNNFKHKNYSPQSQMRV